MAVDLRELVADAERLAAPFVAVPIDMTCCPTCRLPYEKDWAGLLRCPGRAHWADRGDEE